MEMLLFLLSIASGLSKFAVYFLRPGGALQIYIFVYIYQFSLPLKVPINANDGLYMRYVILLFCLETRSKGVTFYRLMN